MPINYKIRVAVLICGAAVSPAMADSYYGVFDIGQATAKDACSGIATWVTGCGSKADLYRITGGYQFALRFGVEASYADYGKASAGKTPFGTSMDWQASSLQISGIGTLPVGEGFAVIGKLGVARTTLKLTGSANASASSTKPAFGIGAQYELSKSVFVRAQYEDLGIIGDTNTRTTKFTLLSVGVGYRF